METLSALEIACGIGLGLGPEIDLVPAGPDPAAALAAVIEPALATPPCLVSFSGGLDSSLVLAVAVRVARRGGLPDPVPVTWRFADAPAAEESMWQEQVIDALGVTDWERLEGDGELDLTGPIATRVLARHGVRHPANAFLHEPLLARAAPGTLLTGFGGDQVLGLWRGRAVADVLAGRRRPRRPFALSAARACAPPRLRSAVELRRGSGFEWLRTPARRDALRLLADERSREPVAWPGHLRWQLRRRDTRISGDTFQAIAAGVGARILHPLLDPGFVAALARHGGWLGFGDRRATIAALFGDVIPPAVLARRDKAIFGEVFWRAPTRALMRAWDGEAVDRETVDPTALKAVWSGDGPFASTALLVHQIWLARA